MASLTTTELTRRLAGAILATEQRARDGYSAVSTAKRQVRALWARIEADGLRRRVEDVLPILAAVRS